ncbi:MAG TPA: hypothetical protein VGB08_07515, partial [Allosphingosinicella sp.]
MLHAHAFAARPAPEVPSPAAGEGPAAAAAAVLAGPDEPLDPLEVKLAFDAMVDPTLDREAARAETAR